MTGKVFCYHCRNYHPLEEMTCMESKGRKRWRCRKSLASSRTNQAQRDAFGGRVSELNKANDLRSLPHCVLELFVA